MFICGENNGFGIIMICYSASVYGKREEGKRDMSSQTIPHFRNLWCGIWTISKESVHLFPCELGLTQLQNAFIYKQMHLFEKCLLLVNGIAHLCSYFFSKHYYFPISILPINSFYLFAFLKTFQYCHFLLILVFSSYLKHGLLFPYETDPKLHHCNQT